MANFSGGYILTQKGEELQALAEAGKLTLNLTKMQLGNGSAGSMQDYYKRDGLIFPINSMTITEKEEKTIGEKSFCILHSTLTNNAVEYGYMAYELGIFALDADGKEVLFAASYDENPSYIASKDDSTEVVMSFEFIMEVSSSEQITLTLPATAEELAALAQQKAIEAAESAREAATSASSAQSSLSAVGNSEKNASMAAANAAADAATAASAASSATKDAKAAASSAAAALESSTGATTAMNETKKQAQQAAASIAEASALVDKTEKNSAVVSEQLKQAQALATASAGIQIYLDDDGDLAYRMIE